MKKCIYKKDIMCFQEEDFERYMFFDKYPDEFNNDNEFIKNIKERKKHGCKVCHFYKAGFKGTAKAIPLCLFALAC